MNSLIDSLFCEYLEKQPVSAMPGYSDLAHRALETERALRTHLSPEASRLFEDLSEMTARLHYLEVEDAFRHACRLGAQAAKELVE